MPPAVTNPLKLSPRLCALLVGIFTLLALFVGSYRVLTGDISWSQYAIRAAISVALGAAAVGAYALVRRFARRASPERTPYFHIAPMLISMVLFYVLSWIHLTPWLFTAVGSAMWIFPFSIGTTLMSGGWVHRKGDSQHCPRCEYEFNFPDPNDAPIRCPECGSGWLGMLRKGRRVKSNRMILAGVAVVLGSMLIFHPVFYMGWLGRNAPTSILYTALYIAPRSGYFAWGELAKRPLDPEWAAHMGDRILANRARGTSDSSACEWFEAAITSNSVTPEQVERYYAESLIAEIRAPNAVQAGKSFRVSISVKNAPPSGARQMGIMFAGYSIVEPGEQKTTDDEGERVGRRHATLWRHEMRTRVFDSRGDVLQETLIAPAQGDFEVRAVYWLVHQPNFSENLKWQDDGTPERPAAAVWFERVELKRTVRVRTPE